MKKSFLQPLYLWILINLFAGFYLWQRIVVINFFNSNQTIISFSNFILFIVILNSVLALLAKANKQPLLGYLANTLTTYLEILIFFHFFLFWQ